MRGIRVFYEYPQNRLICLNLRQYTFSKMIHILIEFLLHCNCNYFLFTKLPWPGDCEGTFRSSSQAATCPYVYTTYGGGFTLSV